MFKLLAKQRLLADETPSVRETKHKKKEALDKQIDEKQSRIENIKKGLPSKLNKMKVSEVNKITKRKEINNLKNQVLDLRLKKETI
jgi:hypothetical protein